MQLQHVKVSTRLYIGFGILLLFCFMIAAFGAYGLQRSNAALHHLADVNVTKIELLNQMNESIHIEARVMRTVALLHDDQEAERQARKITDARKRYDEAYAAIKQMPLDDAGHSYVQKIGDSATAATAINNHFMELAKSDRDAAVAILLQQGIPTNATWQNTLHEFTDLQESKNHNDEAAAESSYQYALWSMLGLGVAAVVVGALVGAAIARSIALQLGGEPEYTVSIANEIAQGNLAVHIDSKSGDESSLLHSVQVMRDSLADMVNKVRHSSESIGVGINEISSGNADLSARTDSQASTLEETSASVQQLTATVRQNAENANEASSLAKQASEQAEQGGYAVDDVVSTMTSIQDSSRKVVDIISVIDGIAFQTNILALNAAVEAARAGEQGRGFAVVATEVRTLAQHSANAAKEIKALIDTSVKEVEIGTRKVDQAGDVMKKLVQSVRRVNQLIADIAVANREQSSGIEQVNEAVTQMDETTQQNAALVEQATAAAHAMQSQTQQLIELVGTFRVDESLRKMEANEPANAVQTAGRARGKISHNETVSQTGHLALSRS